jgi:acetyl esterase/lipase
MGEAMPAPIISRQQGARAVVGAVAGALAVAVAAPGAAANVPATVTKADPVRIPWASNSFDGTLTTTLTYSDTTASATASSGTSIGLGKGYSFRLRTCVAYHLDGAAPVSKCAERSVDTHASSGSVHPTAPSVMLSGPRPTTQPWGYFTAYTEVLYLNGTTWEVTAQSWPDNGLQGAGIAVAPQGQPRGALPPNSSVALDGPFNSAINSGQADSICASDPIASNGSALPAGVSTTHPGFPNAPAYYEVGLPTGAFLGQAPRGVMLVINGGGWSMAGVGGVQAMRPDADRWRARGWETVNVTYRPCGQSIADVLWFYDHARARFGPTAKIAALGTSAGGHLALLVGAYRPALYAAVSLAGPTDLTRIQGELTFDAATGLTNSTVGGRWVHNLAAAAFGEENLAGDSPAVQVAANLKDTRVLQAFSADDAIVPFEQAGDLDTAMHLVRFDAYVDDVRLAAGTIPFAHGRVTQPALNDFYAREAALVAPVTTPTVPLELR